MIIRFGVSNFYSLHETTELSLVASKGIKDEGPDLLEVPNLKEKLLPAALIYGANGAGKTSVWLALREMRDHVLNSFSKLDPDDPVPNTPYALDPTAKSEPTHFDCDFIIEGVRHHYGFEISDEIFSEEWLYSYPEGSRRVLFHRHADPSETEFGNSFKGSKKSLLSILRPNALLVSTGAQAGHQYLKFVYDFFKNKISFAGPSFSISDAVSRRNPKIDPRVVKFLGIADTGIVSAKVEFEETPEDALAAMEKIRQAMQPMLGNSGRELEAPPSKVPKIIFGHTGSTDTVDIPISAESRGTIRLVGLMDKIFSALDVGKTIFIDELDASLHSSLSVEILNLFSKKEFNPNGAQILATTHDTNLLCNRSIRRDQIWFAEKSRLGSTHLYPLTDIKTRNTDNIEKGYLQGRFGAIPFFGGLGSLFDETE